MLPCSEGIVDFRLASFLRIIVNFDGFQIKSYEQIIVHSFSFEILRALASFFDG